MAETFTFRIDNETDHALDVLTHGGISRSAAIRQAVLEAASRRERAAQMRREILRMDLGEPDGVNVADELARDRSGER
ncbi:MAG TPA: ribbon-helix-helix protein, CopG family [Streptosporangiaceae bacterium]|jgi:Arc/MetJ-type ribon-helix-helix transcriptional regulator|nr:ribbon-helix-helix protein, CopG family [Streptosporangiaceae bacterium]